MLGLGELAIILIVVILVLGAKRLPDLARSAGKSARILKSEARAMKAENRPPDGQEDGQHDTQHDTQRHGQHEGQRLPGPAYPVRPGEPSRHEPEDTPPGSRPSTPAQ
ncbi:Sec-independent protein translocase subunit TatA [Streptomyces sp. NBC_01511]|uniref:Sec-independent protein translocase subunit TatA n=1 Tax=Streptomyces sp. NBC_01511 TaxID=2903889 RepID=UPI00386B8BB5